jgi:hypothetical protein
MIWNFKTPHFIVESIQRGLCILHYDISGICGKFKWCIGEGGNFMGKSYTASQVNPLHAEVTTILPFIYATLIETKEIINR